MTINKTGSDPRISRPASKATTEAQQTTPATTVQAPTIDVTAQKPATGVTSIPPREVAAGSFTPPPKNATSPIALQMSSKLTVNDNVYVALAPGAKLNGPMVQALFDVIAKDGVSPQELKDARAIMQHFTARNDANAPMLQELTFKLQSVVVDQGFVTTLTGKLKDALRVDHYPSLTAEALSLTSPESTDAWAQGHSADKAPGVQDADGAAAIGDKGIGKAEYVVCPVLGSLVDEGSLKLDKDGNASLKEFNDLMVNRLGITAPRAAVTVGTTVIGNHGADLGNIVVGGKINLNHLHGSFLDHQGRGDTGVLQGGKFHEDKFQALVRHSSDGKSLSIKDFAKAINDQLKRDGGFATYAKGISEDIFEMGALINTFGYKDEKGERRIDISTMRDLYQHRKLPPKDELMNRAGGEKAGIVGHVVTMAKMGIEMVKNR